MIAPLDARDWSLARAHLAAADVDMRPLVTRWPDERLEPHGDVFCTVARAISGQQISVTAAERIWARLMALLGRATPQAVLGAGEEALFACGLTRRKAAALVAIAARFALSGSIPATRADLLALPSVGPWTANMVAIFALGTPNVLPLSDIGLRRAVERRRGLPFRGLDDEAFVSLAEPWRPWRTVAVWHLWRALDPVPVVY